MTKTLTRKTVQSLTEHEIATIKKLAAGPSKKGMKLEEVMDIINLNISSARSKWTYDEFMAARVRAMREGKLDPIKKRSIHHQPPNAKRHKELYAQPSVVDGQCRVQGCKAKTEGKFCEEHAPQQFANAPIVPVIESYL